MTYFAPAPATGGTGTSWPAITGETAATALGYYYGNSRRYGIVPGDGVNHENNGDNDKLKANASLAAICARFEPGYYATGANLRAVFTGSKYQFDPGASFGEIFHLIAAGVQATATAPNNATIGGVASVTVTAGGSGYFKPPYCSALGSTAGVSMTGVVLTPTMTVDAVDMVLQGGAGFAVNDTITIQGGAVLTVSAVTAGAVTAASVTTAGSYADPSTVCLDGNQFTQTATSGSGTGFRALVKFKVASVAVTAAGSGATGAVTVFIDPPGIENVTLSGQLVTYGRFGVQGFKNCAFDRVWLRNDTTKNISGNGNPGVHIDYGDGLYGREIRVEGTKQIAASPNGWAGISIDGSGSRTSRNVNIQRLAVDSADAVGISICSREFQSQKIEVAAFGAAASVIATQYVGPATGEAYGLYVYRACGNLGDIFINQNEVTAGASATYHALFASTESSTGASSLNPVDNKDIANNQLVLPVTFKDAVFRNVAGKGIGLVDRVTPDASQPCNVRGKTISVHASSGLAQTAGYQLLHLNKLGGSPNQPQRTSLIVDDIEFLQTATKDCLFVDTACELIAQNVRFPAHGAGKLAVINGLFKGRLYADAFLNGITPASSANTMFTFGPGCDGSVIEVVADAGVAGLNLVYPVISMVGTSAAAPIRNVKLNAKIDGYRNATIVTLGNLDNCDIELYVSWFHASAFQGTGIQFQGTFTNCRFKLFVDGMAAGLAVSGTPVFTNCSVVDSYVSAASGETAPRRGNTTPTAIPNGTFATNLFNAVRATL